MCSYFAHLKLLDWVLTLWASRSAGHIHNGIFVFLFYRKQHIFNLGIISPQVDLYISYFSMEDFLGKSTRVFLSFYFNISMRKYHIFNLGIIQRRYVFEFSTLYTMFQHKNYIFGFNFLPYILTNLIFKIMIVINKYNL